MQLKDYKLEDGGSCDVALLISFVKAEGDRGLRAKKTGFCAYCLNA